MLAQQVAELVHQKATAFPRETIDQSLKTFWALNFDPSYLVSFDANEIAHHVHGFILAQASQAAGRPFEFNYAGDFRAFYFCTAEYDRQLEVLRVIESFLERRREAIKTHAISVHSYNSADNNLLLVTVDLVPLRQPGTKSKNFEDLANDRFFRTKEDDVKARYSQILAELADSFTPVYKLTQLDGENINLMLGFFPDRLSLLTTLTTAIHFIKDAVITKKYMESFANGAQVYSFYIRGASATEVEKAAVTLGMLPHVPQRPTTRMFLAQKVDASEVLYMDSLRVFAYYFTKPRVTDDYNELERMIQHYGAGVRRLKNLRANLFSQVITETFLLEMMEKHLTIVKALYADFCKGSTPASTAKLDQMIESQLRGQNQVEIDVLKTFVKFNRAVLKTNFFKVKKAAASFRLDPSFIKELDFPRVPFGIFMIVGAEFRGFHVRFTDIARGGIRIIRSNANTYAKNRSGLFQETYNLAHAQLMKNKDIPEGGSKGAILVSDRWSGEPMTLFLQYIDALLDVIIPNVEGVRDNLKTEEILFLGPDEGTAGVYPEVAAMHAKARGYKQWKSFTTGKAQRLGGIPHDMYGMTSRGVRAYIEGIYEKLNLEPAKLTKFQTGGPDGDLGSNEILLSNERYIGLVDGSGCLYDPKGVSREELMRLARERVMLKNFNKSELSAEGFFVGIEERNRKLPDGTLVEHGEMFRNGFHLSRYAIADIFVPCGGRPASVTIDNVSHFLLNVPGATGQAMLEGKIGNLATSGKLRFKYVVEGANLFITHEARIALESVGVILFKDSSANKGGVTCSSLEVLSGLALTDAEHATHMCMKGDTLPAFYNEYVEEAKERLAYNAKREFEIIWSEKKLGHGDGFNTVISDRLSSKIVDFRSFILASSLFDDKMLVKYVLSRYLPATLRKVVPVEKAMKRIPESYLRSIFAIWIASDFVYSVGLGGNDFSFFKYMHNLTQLAAAGSKL